MLPRLWRGVRRTSVNKIHAISADLDPVPYAFWVLRSTKSAGLEQLHYYPLEVWTKPGTLSLFLLRVVNEQ
jgi:hypothetical protein